MYASQLSLEKWLDGGEAVHSVLSDEEREGNKFKLQIKEFKLDGKIFNGTKGSINSAKDS